MSSRVFLVTGSNTGIGYELVKNLAQKEGNTVYLASRNEAAGKEAQANLSKEGLKVEYVQLDIQDKASISAAVSTIEKAEGKLDVLVNNAGNGFMSENQNAVNIDEGLLRKAMDLNFFATVNTTQAFVPLLLKGQSPIVVMVSTDMASNTKQAQPNSFLHVTAYNTSKAAQNSYSIALAAELRSKCRVISVTPGFTSTKLNNFGEGGKTPAQGAAIIAKYALLGPEEDITAKFYDENGEYPW